MTARLSDPTADSGFDQGSPSSKTELLRYLHHELTNDDREHISSLAAAKAVPMYLVEAGYMVVMFKQAANNNLNGVVTDPADMSVRANVAVPAGEDDSEVLLWISVIEALVAHENNTSGTDAESQQP